MALAALIPVAEYLATSYRPDRDYIDGEVLERNVGEKPHGLLQGILFTIFVANEKEWNWLPLLEQRVQTGSSRFRIPDVCLVDPLDPDLVIQRAPFLCVEVLSKDDTLRSMQERVDDYLHMGVPHIWLFDPALQRAWRASNSGFEAVSGTLSAKGSPVHIDVEQVFRRLNDRMAGILGSR